MKTRLLLALVAVMLPLALMADPASDSFALDLYRRIAEGDGNAVVSPLSVATALRMIQAGARGATAEEIAHAVGSRGTGPLPKSVQSANALWVAKGRTLRQEYVAELRRDFGATAEGLNFVQEEQARARINGWVSEKTRKMIPEIIPPGVLNSLTRLVVTNAVYLKADWLHPFEPSGTRDAPFHLRGSRDVTVKIMSDEAWLSFAETGGVKLVELPYKDGDMSMLAILPASRDGLPALEKVLTASTLTKWTGAMTPQMVRISLPRYRMAMSRDLVADLQALGIRLVFRHDGSGDLSGISTDEKLYVTNILHRARVDVDEKGTEAAAATAGVIGVTSAVMPSRPPAIFRADHPFLFAIRSKAGEILFIGRVEDPTRD